MITLNASGGSVTFTFSGNSTYLNDGQITVPVNSLALIIDESDMATFRKAASNDIFVSANIAEFGMTKDELESWFKENAVGSTGGGGDITSGEVQTMIDESISGKADSSAVTEEISAAVSGKADTSYVDSAVSGKVDTTTFNTYSGSVETALSGKQDTLIAGRGISITTGETADTVSFNLPISAGTGTNSIVEGNETVASGDYSHAEGCNTTASGQSSHAEGYRTTASGQRSHAEGNRTTASGQSSHAEGAYTLASAYQAHAEGDNTVASGSYSHAEGGYTLASAYQAHAEGYSTKAIGESSHAEGDHTIANNEAEHASGKYNVSNTGESTSAQTLFSVGNGTADNARHNAFEIRYNGDIYLNDGSKLQDTITATTANTTALGGMKIVKITESDYQSLSVKDPDTLYVVIPDTTNP